MKILTPRELYDRILRIITIWTTGIKKDKVGGYVKITLKNADKGATIRYNIAINRVLVKKTHEARGFIELTVSRSVKEKKGTEPLSLPSEKKVKHLFNMSYYMFAQEGKTTHNFFKYLDNIMTLRETKTSLILPPFIPDFVERLEKRLVHIYSDLEHVYNVLKPEEVSYKVDITGKKSDIIVGEALGRTIRLITAEYSDESNLRNIKRMLVRHGGLSKDEVRKFDEKWHSGVKELIRISIDYMRDLLENPSSEDFIKGLLAGMIQESEDPSVYFNAFLYLSDIYNVGDKLRDIQSIIRDKLRISYEEFDANKHLETRSRIIVNAFLKKDYDKVKQVINDLDEKELDSILSNILTDLTLDRETRLAISLKILEEKNVPLERILTFTNEMIIDEESLVGAIITAIRTLSQNKREEILVSHQRLAKHVSRFAFSKDIRRFPYSILIPISYKLLSEMEKREGLHEKAEKTYKIALRIENFQKKNGGNGK